MLLLKDLKTKTNSSKECNKAGKTDKNSINYNIKL